jgi:hypothetical protein
MFSIIAPAAGAPLPPMRPGDAMHPRDVCAASSLRRTLTHFNMQLDYCFLKFWCSLGPCHAPLQHQRGGGRPQGRGGAGRGRGAHRSVCAML